METGFLIGFFVIIVAVLGELAWIAFKTPVDLLASILEGNSIKATEYQEQTDNASEGTKATDANQEKPHQVLPAAEQQAAMNTDNQRSDGGHSEEEKNSNQTQQPNDSPKWTDKAIVILAFCSLIVAGVQSYFSSSAIREAQQANVVATRP